ncbi:MAG: dihydroorotate dehydrogenase electron transfer subunit [Proteobacteria bacterium]|nr:dihydroorotate dehydrogenase electron transfer subunit [Pseudomonadota bacterium]
MKRINGKIIARKILAKDIFLISIELEEEFGNFGPGNFIMLGINDFENILPRPFSIYHAENKNIRLIIKTVGSVTGKLLKCSLPYEVSVLGPLGNSFPLIKGNNLIISGGIGIVPLFDLVNRINVECFFAGFRTKEEIFLVENINKISKIYLSTDDGSFGHKGFITDYLEDYLIKNRDRDFNIFACGPHPFLKKLWDIGKRLGVSSIFASFETYMACGFGVCLGCTVETPKGFVKVCKDGPVFNLNDIFGE